MTILLKRGTRSALNDQANRGLLHEGEPLFITDEGRLGVGMNSSSYSTFVRQTEITDVIRTSNLTNVAAAGTLNTVATATANYFPTIENVWLNNNVTLNGSPLRITVSQPGVYLAHVQQLVTTPSNGTYLEIRKNGVVLSHSYSAADDTYDLVNSCLIYLAANDYIDFYYRGGGTTYAWGGAHSYWFLQRTSYV